MTAIVAQTNGVWKRYRQRDVLQGLDLAVPEGAAYALIGANGAGKTTTFKLLLNILQPTRGTATVLGCDSRRLSPRAFASIGYVSENQMLPARLSVGRYLDYLRPFYAGWDRALEHSIRERLRLPATSKIGELSHGQRIKVQLACALSYRPKLLILDEPFSGLDPLVREEFMQGLLLQASEMTVVISSHELGEIENVVTHVGFLDSGRLLLQEPISELHARVRDVSVTLDRAATLPEGLPKQWLQPKAFGNVLSFIDTQYSEAQLRIRIDALFGNARRIESQALPLRSVFTTLARAARDGTLP